MLHGRSAHPRVQAWYTRIRDKTTLGRIAARIDTLEKVGHFGMTRSVGGGVSEMKLDYGPGYRIYFTRRGEDIVLLLLGGDKSTQMRDILVAQQLADALE